MLKNLLAKLGFEKKVIKTKCFLVTITKNPWSNSITVIVEPTGFVFVNQVFTKSVDFNVIKEHVINVFDSTDSSINFNVIELAYYRKEAEKQSAEIIDNEEVVTFFAV